MLRQLVQQQPHTFYSSRYHIFDSETDGIVATVYGEDLDVAHVLGASKHMQLAIMELKRLRFGASGNSCEWAAAVSSAIHALDLSLGEIQ